MGMQHELHGLRNRIQEKYMNSVKLHKEVCLCEHLVLFVFARVGLCSLLCSCLYQTFQDSNNQESWGIQVLSICSWRQTKSRLLLKNPCQCSRQCSRSFQLFYSVVSCSMWN